jgi:small-conductance mechanosensitive channel
MNDLITLLWFILFAIGFPAVIGLWTRQNNTYQDAVRLSGLATVIIGTLIVLVAAPFMSFGETSSLTFGARGEAIRSTEYLRLWDGPTSEALVVTMVSFLIPLLLLGMVATKYIPLYPRLATGLLWVFAIWLLGWQGTMQSNASTFIVAVPIMAIVTAVFGTLAFKAQKRREPGLRHSAQVAG